MEKTDNLECCRFCKSNKIKFIFKRESLHIFKCLDCSLVFLGNNLDDETIKNFYEYYGHETFQDGISPITELRYEELLDDFEEYRQHNSMIDVGCGTGHFMLSAGNRGWDVDGTEIAEEAIKLAAQRGQKVIRGDISALELEKDKYDIATLAGVIEHVSDPEAIVRKLRHIIRPGGIIYITTPNYNDITRMILGKQWGIFHKEHLFYFTAKNLTSLLNKYDFRIKKIKTESLMLREVLRIFKKMNVSNSLNDSIICQKQESIRQFIEKNSIFLMTKHIINLILDLFEVGGTIYVIAEKGKY